MYRKILVLVFVLVAFFLCTLSFAQEAEKKEISKDQIVAVATETLKGQGFNLEGAQIIYDENNKLWIEQIGKWTELDKSPNFGILKRGFTKNYRTVYFDFKEPAPDAWVFIDKDTGEVLEVYLAK